MNNEQREQQMMDAADRYADEIYKDEPDNSHTDEQLCETINDFCAGWRAADQHPHWIPVEERLPEKRGNYIVYARRKLVTDMICEAIFDSKFWYKQSSGAYLEVTHWMPLPEAPRKEE